MINTAYAEDNSTLNATISNDNFDDIQNLIDNAESGDSIYLENKTYEVNTSSITINKDISIYGSDTVLDAKNKSNILTISKNSNVNLYGITFINAKTDSNGAAIDNYGTVTIHNSKFINNTAECGAVRGNSDSTLTVYDSLFENNRADSGAAIDAFETNSKIVNCTFTKNQAGEGGAMYTRFGQILG